MTTSFTTTLASTPAITVPLCAISDLVPYSGVAANYNGLSIALFYLPDQHPAIYALGHLDPVTQAPVIAHGLIGESQGEFYVASPLYKQQYRLRDGVCLQQPELQLPTYSVAVSEGKLWLLQSADTLQACA
ncbi:nitrite reductase small subunit NirD [Rheinheimera riviphila]|uniref:Nitrite reductase small subunit NirD n=1 Tax=Rheinheimera riviphila TaxID=1834037 RepID=A0A437QSH9_9GAMM|nr:nitrite reductase small subunit NirD [Rheinheimera riviphila]RVU37444.1 nitrite reductase small subunit NirD [Rheinheimera riviphila]